MNQQTVLRSPQSISEENARFMSGVYKWMTFGVLLTAFIAYYVSTSKAITNYLFTNKILLLLLIFVFLASAVSLSFFIKRMSALLATIIYFFFASVSGFLFSVIFVVYTMESIQGAFLTAACGFAGLSAFGYITKKDLGPIGTFCHMGLWGLIGFSILALFFPSMMSGQLEMIYSLVGIVVFAGLTAYDTQKIKNSNIIGNEGSAEDHKETIIGALTLYLDFINLFLMILRLMGNRRR